MEDIRKLIIILEFKYEDESSDFQMKEWELRLALDLYHRLINEQWTGRIWHLEQIHYEIIFHHDRYQM